MEQCAHSRQNDLESTAFVVFSSCKS